MVSTPVILLPAESQPPHHNESEGFAPSDPPLSSTKIAQLVRKNGSLVTTAVLGHPPVLLSSTGARVTLPIAVCNLCFRQ